ncbi:MAG: metal-sulfur cluster assembly factor [Desulfurococcales archaeon]|nr:metal-sulfur cluster assembly factor [Desulfurococcales archaeon]MCC6062545.1 metal-sulfur cluster assembly factor [Desulfurococcales archaeon]
MDEKTKEEWKRKIIDTLEKIYDPEIPIDVYNLGLIYDINITDEGVVNITMTLTAIGCPVANVLPYQVYEALQASLPEAKEINIDVVFDPPWTPLKMTEKGRKMFIEIFGYDIVEQWRRRTGE